MIPARCCCSRLGSDASFLFCSDPFFFYFLFGVCADPTVLLLEASMQGVPIEENFIVLTHSFATIPIRCDFLSCTQGQGLGTRDFEVSRAGQDVLDNGTTTQCVLRAGFAVWTSTSMTYYRFVSRLQLFFEVYKYIQTDLMTCFAPTIISSKFFILLMAFHGWGTDFRIVAFPWQDREKDRLQLPFTRFCRT